LSPDGRQRRPGTPGVSGRGLLFLLLAWLGLPLTLLAQAPAESAGSISGRVSDSWDGKGLPGVTITLRGFTLATTTDSQGNYTLPGVPPGTHVLQFFKGGYVRMVVENVRVVTGQTSRADAPLKPDYFLMETVEVVEEPFQEQQVEILEAQQKSVNVVVAVGTEMMSKLGLGDVSEVMNRVTGAAVVDGKFAVIRGVGDRYTTALLNGAEIPSADPYRKSAQLDLFPSAMIDRVEVNKTFMPEMPGSSSGGVINIVTKSFPEKFFFNFSFGATYNTQSSLNDNFLSSPGGRFDWAARDDGSRALPEALLDTPVPALDANNPLLDSLTRSFKIKQMGPVASGSGLNHNFSFSSGDKVKLKGRDFGWFAALNYERKFNFYDNGEVGRYLPLGGGIQPRLVAADVRGTEEVAWGAAVNLAYKTSELHEFGFNFIYSQTAEDEARRITGFHLAEANAGDVFDSTVLRYTQRNLHSFQFKGNHLLPVPNEVKLDWTVSLVNTSQDEPDLRYMSMFHDINGITGFSNQLFPQTPTRFFRSLEENNLTARVDNTWPFLNWTEVEGQFKVGGYQSFSSREYRDRGFAYQSRNDFGPWFADGDPARFLELMEANVATRNFFITANPPNRYDGRLDLKAFYFSGELPLLNQLKLVGGLRVESTMIDVRSVGGSLATTAAASQLQQSDLLPAAGLIYNPKTNMNVRLHYSGTIARPTYREIANVETFDFAGGDILVGNPALKLSSVRNYDVRWEWFPRPSSVLSVGGFYKQLTAPIEQAYTTLDQDKITYVNRTTAEVMGYELEARVGFDWFSPHLEDFSLGANYASIQSETPLTPAELAFKQTINPAEPGTRQLYDQSPYILNLDFTYDNQKTAFTVAYNMTGPRLYIVNPFGEDVYEHPGDSLDLSLSQKLGKRWKVKFSAKNLLDPVFKRTYGENGSLIYSSHTKGRQFGVSFSCNF